MGMINKRRLLLSIGGTGLILGTRSAAASATTNTPSILTPSPTDEEASEMLRSEGEALKTNPTKTVKSAFWYQRKASERQLPQWPDELNAFDYRHLSGIPTDDRPFEINASILSTTLAACNFDLSNSGQRVLFGLRGCQLANSAAVADFEDSHLLVQARPDHVNARCLLGVFDQRTQKIFLARGSTVPVIDLMECQVKRTLGCNMLPTGFYQYRVGAHKGIKQPGAFRQTEPTFVHRANINPVYSLDNSGNEWDDGNGVLQYDNIHAAMLSNRDKPPFYSSAGCQVVEGTYIKDSHQPFGPWAAFRIAAGLDGQVSVLNEYGATKDDGKKYDYFLITGKDIAIASTNPATLPKTFRFGSSGDGVYLLTKKLQLTKYKDRFDLNVFDAVLNWQIAKRLPPTGIVSENQLSDL